jgi:hypothetical protein
MSLPLPRLDNRTFEQLVAEGRQLIPRSAPGWTDHNYHDPGITLIDLFAWLVEGDIFRLDRVGDASYRAFLHLLGVEPRPAQPAEAVLIISQEPPQAAHLALPAGLQVTGPGHALVFETMQPVNLSPARLEKVLSRKSGAQVEITLENSISGRAFLPFGLRPQPGDALILGFDRPLAGEAVEIGLYVWSADPAQDRLTRQALQEEQQALIEEAAACPPGVRPEPPDWRQHYSARTVWEYFAGSAGWKPLAGVTDETRGQSLSGAVRFLAPLDHAALEGLFPIRCRLESGGYECPPQLQAVALNPVLASHAAGAGPEEALGPSTGRAGQRFTLRQGPALPGSAHLRLVAGDVEQTWQEAAFWDQVGPHERAFLLAPDDGSGRGEIQFGDGRSGRIPPPGVQLFARYRVGGGLQGNLPAGSLRRFLDNPHNAALLADWAAVFPTLRLAQPFPALGGAAPETLEEAQGRLLESLASQARAVTLADYEDIALRTPGAPVARARAIADYHPALPCFPAAGSVTVVVVPACPDLQPEPSGDFLGAVHRYLERRRTLATELHVIGPCYLPVRVSARLHALAQSSLSTASLVSQAEGALDAFFHPLTGGPDGAGWPVGRDVYQSEILALLSALPGVDYVDELGFLTGSTPSGQAGEALCSNVTVCPDCLVQPGPHRIRVERRMAR